MTWMDYKNRKTFRDNYLLPLQKAGFLIPPFLEVQVIKTKNTALQINGNCSLQAGIFNMTQQEQKSSKEVFTDLFLEQKTDQTPAVVEHIVTDIDDIVKIVRFDGRQTTTSGEREVQRSLRKTLLKYKLHKDQDLFERAYAYVKQYY